MRRLTAVHASAGAPSQLGHRGPANISEELAPAAPQSAPSVPSVPQTRGFDTLQGTSPPYVAGTEVCAPAVSSPQANPPKP